MKIKKGDLNKLRLIGLISLGVLAVAATVIIIVLINKKKTAVVEKKPVSENLIAAKKTLDWMEKQRDEKGNYIKTRICVQGDGENCNQTFPSGESGHDVISAIWARYEYYKQTGDPKDMEIMSKDLENYATNFQVQTDFWNCRMMYEMYKDSVFDKEQKKNISKICTRGSYYDVPGFTNMFVNRGDYDMLIENSVSDIDLNRVISNDPKLKDELISLEGIPADRVQLYAAYPSDYVARYQWKNLKHELDLAKLYFNVTTTFYVNSNSNLDNEAFCRYGISAVDLWKATNDKNYLDYAAYLFNKEIVPAAETPISFRRYVRPTCGLFADEMFKATTNNGYKEKRDDIVKYMKQDYRDSDQGFTWIENDGAFFMGGNNGYLMLAKEVRTNALAIALLSSL